MTRSRPPAAGAQLHRLPLLLGAVLLALLLAAPSAQAWHGYLKIKKVVVDANSARKSSADFDFTVDRQGTPPSGAWTSDIVNVPYLSNGEYWVSPAWNSGGETGVPWKRFRVSEVAAGGAGGQALSDYETSFACETPFRWDGGPSYSYKWNVVMGWGAWPPSGLPQSGEGTQVTTELRWDAIVGGYATLCTFTNKRKPTIKVVKDFVSEPSGESETVGFTVNGSAVTTSGGSSHFADGSQSDPIRLATSAAAPTIAETGGSVDPGDYLKTISCTDASDPAWSYSTQSDDADGSWTLPGPLAPGQDVTCTVANDRKDAKLRVTKIWDAPAGVEQSVELTINGSVAGTSSAPQGSTSSTVTVAGGSINSYGEQAPGGGPLDPAAWETTDLGCVDGETPLENEPGSVTVAPGADVTCTIRNSRRTGKLTLRKLVVPAGDPGRFLLTADGPLAPLTTQPLGDGGQESFTVPTGEYALSEAAAPGTSGSGYTLGEPLCSRAGDGERAAEVVPVVAGRIAVGALDDITCTWTNTRNSTPTPPPSTPPAGGTAGAGGSAPGGGIAPGGGTAVPAARPGTARISGTVGCATAKYASATVHGRQIARVTFFVNGRKAKTMTRANVNGAFRLRYRTRELRVGAYRVRARVEFKAASGTRPRTLSLQFSRCGARSVQPTFTG